jgi:hypothetical protein
VENICALAVIVLSLLLSTLVHSTSNMTKEKCSDSVRLSGFVKEFGEKYFTTNGVVLFCKLCEVKVTAEKRFTVRYRKEFFQV